jgi:hypothetical protein
MDAGPGLVILAGVMTFANEWYQTGKGNWRVPVATLLAAALVGGLASFAPGASKALGGIVLIGAVTAKFGGKSVIEELNTAINGGSNVIAPRKGK